MAEKRSCKTILGKSLCKRGVNDTSMVKVAGCEPTAPTPVVRYQAVLHSVLYEQYAWMGLFGRMAHRQVTRLFMASYAYKKGCFWVHSP